MANKKRIFIRGMHCTACVSLLKDEFEKIPGIISAEIFLKDSSAILEYDSELFPFSPCADRAEALGYGISYHPIREKIKASVLLKEWLGGALLAGALLGLYLIAEKSGLIPGYNAGSGSGSVSYGVAFLIGLAASVSSCFAIVGSLVLALGETWKPKEDGKGVPAFVRSQLLFQGGRVFAFFLLGGVLAAIGGTLRLSGPWIAAITIVSAVVLFTLALRILGFGGFLARVLPSSKAKRPRIMDRLKSSGTPLAPVALGALTFFLPCGFTQSMQIMALSSGDFWRGAMLLLFFVLGTVPVLLVAGLSAAWSKNKKIGFVGKGIGLLVLVFSVTTFISAVDLFGYSGDIAAFVAPEAPASENAALTPTVPELEVSADGSYAAAEARSIGAVPGTGLSAPAVGGNSPTNAPQAGNTETAGPVQTVEMHILYSGFSPARITLHRGLPVEFVIWGDEVTGCTNAIVIPGLDLGTRIRPGRNVLRFEIPEGVSTIPYSCWMGMVHGTFDIEG